MLDKETFNVTSIYKYSYVEDIATGEYASVYKGVNKETGKEVAIKDFKDQEDTISMANEIRVLRALKGGPHLLQLEDIAIDETSEEVFLVFEYINAIDFRDKSREGFTYEEVKMYLKQLMEALAHMHSRGIMHLDIKSGNILIDPKKKELTLIDFGLSIFYQANMTLETDNYPFYYRPPDLWLGNTQYSYTADIWAAGCLFAGMLFRTAPFIRGRVEEEQL